MKIAWLLVSVFAMVLAIAHMAISEWNLAGTELAIFLACMAHFKLRAR